MARQMSQIEYNKIFDLMEKDSGIEITDIIKEIPSRDDKTIKRAYHAAQYCMSLGNSKFDKAKAEEVVNAGQFPDSYEISAKYLFDTYNCYRAWLDKKKPNKDILKDAHLKDMLEQLRILNSCTTNPHLYLYHGKDDDRHIYPMEVNDHDCRLDPRGWFRMVTPDLSNENEFGSEFPSLKQHMKESPFWKHYQEMKNKAYTLGDKIDKAGTKLSESDEVFRIMWQTSLNCRCDPNCPSRTPLKPVPDWDDFRLPTYEQESAFQDLSSKIIKQLQPEVRGISNMPHDCFEELEDLLLQLFDDLNSEELRDMILQRHCDRCLKYLSI